MSKKIALLHPGNMGVSVGRCATQAGHHVAWVSEGRSEKTIERACSAGFRMHETLDKLLGDSEIVMSVCPPSAAISTAMEVADFGFSGVYLDANAISPETTLEIAKIIHRCGAKYVDGGIIGPPADEENTTRLYLSGPRCEAIQSCFDGTNLEAIVIDESPSAASALKMCYAGWTKGSAALLLSIAALAKSENVGDALRDEWDRSIPGLRARLESSASANVEKAWRFVGEMNEISDAFSANQLPSEFHRGAAAIYERLAQYKNANHVPSLDEILRTLLDPNELT